MPHPVTRRQFEVLQAIQRHQAQTGLSPTLEELGQALQVHRITAYEHVQALLKKGYLQNRARGASRALDLTPAGREALARQDPRFQPPLPFPAEGMATDLAPHPAAGTPPAPQRPPAAAAPRLPLLGRVAAGAPAEAVEDREEVALDELLPLRGELYLLRVQGDSMIEDHIQEGDWVLVRRDRVPRDGDIVVAVTGDGEATLKRLYREPGGFRLQPANRTLQPLVLAELEVRGVVVGVLRRY